MFCLFGILILFYVSDLHNNLYFSAQLCEFSHAYIAPLTIMIYSEQSITPQTNNLSLPFIASHS